MRELKIALGNSRQAKFWSNKTMSFDDICDRLKTPIRTTETAEEYSKLPKPKRDEIKDKGGFVPRLRASSPTRSTRAQRSCKRSSQRIS